MAFKKGHNVPKEWRDKISLLNKTKFKGKGNPFWNKSHTEESKNKMSLAHLSRTGSKVTYRALHKWIRRHKPKSMFCEKCGKITDKLDVANISGDYKRDISDFRWLCRSCHQKRDYKFGIRKSRGKK